MKESNPKPQEILDLEEFYNITLTETDDIEDIIISYNVNSYILNEEGHVIGLNLTNNKINKIQNLKNFKKLNYLNLDDNRINKIEGLENLKLLNILSLDNNTITKIEGLENLKLLVHLYLNGNKINKIENLNNLEKLNYLYLSHNKISKIENLNNLKKLTELGLNNNKISKIENLNNLQQLIFLNLGNNKINKIENLENLEKLGHLYLDYNLIKKIEGIENLKLLVHLYLFRNPLEYEYNIKLDSDNNLSQIQSIIRQDYQDKEEITLPAKVMLLGNHASGKSSFLNYFIKKRLKKNTNNDSTHVLTVQPYEKNNTCLANFYDFGGQDYYHGIYKAFLTNDSINLLFWNTFTNKNQKKGKDSNQIGTINFKRNYWLYQLQYFYTQQKKSTQNEETEPILLIQTHADVEGEIRDTTNQNTEELNIKNEFFISLSKEAVEGNNKLKTVLRYLKEEVLELIDLKSKPEVKTSYEISLIKHIENVKRNPTQENIKAIPIKNLEKHYKTPKKYRTEDLMNLLDQLSKKGMILFYKNNEKLKNYVWLEPDKIVQFIHDTILTKDIITQNKGKVPQKDFEALFGNHKELIEILLINKVIYLDTTNGEAPTYIIPGYLPLADNDDLHYFLFHDLQTPDLTLKFEHFIPFGFMNQLICFYGGNPEKKLYWKDQLLFTYTTEKEKHTAKVLIQLDFEKLTISISLKSMVKALDTNKILQEIYFDLIALYWDDQEYILTGNNEEENIDKKGIGKNIIGKTKIASDKKSLIKRLLKEKPILDAYLSVDGKNFIKYDQLHVETSSFITAHKLNENGFDLDKSNGKSIPIIQFKHFTFNEHIQKMKKIFISYSKKDLAMVNTFLDHLSELQRKGSVGTWYCTELKPADEWSKEIQQHLDESDIVCFMLSANFLKTDYIFNHEIPQAISQNKKIVPIILNFCDWQTGELSKYNGLPYTAKPIKDFKNEDMAWFAIVECLKLLINDNASRLNNPEFFDTFTTNNQYKNSQLRNIYERIVSGKVDV